MRSGWEFRSVSDPRELPQTDSTSVILTNEPYAAAAELREKGPVAESHRGRLVPFTQIAEEEQMRLVPYPSTSQIARGRITELASSPGLNFEAMSILYNQRLFDSARDTQFVLDEGVRESGNSRWRIAHRYEGRKCLEIWRYASFHVGCPKGILKAFRQCRKQLRRLRNMIWDNYEGSGTEEYKAFPNKKTSSGGGCLSGRRLACLDPGR
jgi:hypothetical protein